MKLEKENISYGNVMLRTFQLKDSGLGLEARGLVHGVTMGCVIMNLLHDKLYIVVQAVEEVVSPPSGVPVAVNGIRLYLTWQKAFSGAAPTV